MLLAEIKKVIRSFTYIIFVVVMAGTYLSQMLPDLDSVIAKPQPGLPYYGDTVVETPSVLMPAAAEGLVGEYLTGYYIAYPFMFYKEVHLKEKDEKKIAEIIEKLTGLSKKELDAFAEYDAGGYDVSYDINGNQVISVKEAVLPQYHLKEDITYEEFNELMSQADEIIGGGSKYSKEFIVGNFSRIPMTYEDALNEYEQIVTKENLGKSYTRLFCDYMGIFLAVITIFTAASFWNLDRKAKVTDLIYSRHIASFKIIIVRLAALFICMLPVILLSYFHMIFVVSSLYSEMQISWQAAFLQMLFWLIPQLAIVTVLAALITELVSPLFSIFVQGAWWYMALQANGLVGDISKWTLILRHNSLGDVTIWQNEWEAFLWNRTYYTCLSFVLTVILVFVFSWKRKGKIRFGVKGVNRNYHKKS